MFITYFLVVQGRVIMVTILACAWTLSERNNLLIYFVSM